MTPYRQADIITFIKERGGSTEIVNIIPWIMRAHQCEEQHALRTILELVGQGRIRIDGHTHTKIIVSLAAH